MGRALIVLLFAAGSTGCVADDSVTTALPIEPQTVVLTLEEVPDWATPKAQVVVRGDNDRVLTRQPLSEDRPVLVDVKVPPTAKTLAVAIEGDGHLAAATVQVEGGYASCKLH